MRCVSFKPIIDKDSRVLVLGSMPGVKSLEEQEYYAHPQNHFWKLIAELTGEQFSSYEDKVRVLKKHRIALWDVYKCCVREGSLDTSIIAPEKNDVPGILNKHPNIRLVVFNGKKAASAFPNLRVETMTLPSTSPANTIGFEKKKKEWEKIVEVL